MSLELVIVLLFALAVAVARAARWLQVPYTVALVVSGLVLGAAHALEPPALTKELLYALFLPGLVFEAAFHLEFKKYWQNKLAIHALAVPGVAASLLLTALVMAGFSELLPGEDLPWLSSLVFGGLIVATDPIAVVGLFKSLGAPKRLAALIEGESLLNDGTGVVLFTLILGVATGGAFSLGAALFDFAVVVGAGLLIGVIVGYLASRLIQRIDEPMLEITLTTVAAYGSFALAEHFHFSGVIATVFAGMLCGSYGAKTGMSPSSRLAVESFWEYVAFALNSLVFLLVGLSVNLGELLRAWPAILAAYAAVTLGRGVVIVAVTALLRPSRERVPWAWSAVLTWGGLRGALSMVLALALPSDLPHRALLIHVTFGVVLLSILVQGLTMAPLLRRLGLISQADGRRAYEANRGRFRAAGAALRELERLSKEHAAHPDVLAELREEYTTQQKQAEEEARSFHQEKDELRAEERFRAGRQLLQAQRKQVLEDLHSGLVGEHAAHELLTDLDARLLSLDEKTLHAE